MAPLGSSRERPRECSGLASEFLLEFRGSSAQQSSAQVGSPLRRSWGYGAGWLPAPRLCPCAGNGIRDTLESCAKRDRCCPSWHSPSLQHQGVLTTHPQSKGGQRPSGVRELLIPIPAGLCPCGSSVCTERPPPGASRRTRVPSSRLK